MANNFCQLLLGSKNSDEANQVAAKSFPSKLIVYARQGNINNTKEMTK